MCPVKTLALNSVAVAIWIGFYPLPVTTPDADWFKDVLYFCLVVTHRNTKAEELYHRM